MKLKLRRKLSLLRRYGPAKGWTDNVSTYVVNAITSAVSPRLAGRIKHALPLACLILVVTLGAVVGLVFALRSQTIDSCASVPIPALTGLEAPTCRHLVSSNFAVQSKPGSTNLMAELVWQQVPVPFLYWIGSVGLTAASIFGSFTECSFFPEPCQLVELAFALHGVVDLGNSMQQQPLGSSLPPPPASPPAPLGRKLQQQQPFKTSSAAWSALLGNPRGSIGDAWASGSILITSLHYLNTMASPITDSKAFIQHALSLAPPPSPLPPSKIRPWFINSTVVKLLQAPAGGPCCDVRLERNAAAPGRYAIRLTSANVPDFPPTSESCPNRDIRCSTVSVTVATDFSCWAPESPSTQDYAGSPCSGQNRLDFTADYSISIGSWETLNEDGLSESDAPSSRTFIYRTDKASFDAAQHAPANGSSATAWAAYGLDVPAIYEEHGADMAAWAALMVFAHGYGIAMNSYLAAGSLTAQQVRQAPVHLRLSYYGWANGWWEQMNIYCCESIRPTYLSAIGNALGYASLVEVGVAFVCISAYMLVYPRERKRFGFLFRMMTMAPQDRLLNDGGSEEGDKAEKAEKAAAGGGGGGDSGGGSTVHENSSFRQQSATHAASSATPDLEADQAASDGASVVASVGAIEMHSTRSSHLDKLSTPTKCQ